jgi:uncharacterized membrane protein
MIRPRRGPTGVRVLAASTLGTAAGIAVMSFVPWQAGELVGWDVATVTFLVLTWIVIGAKNARDTGSHAAVEDPSAPLANLVVVTAAVACIVGAGFALGRAASSSGGTKAALIALAVASVLLSWAAVHTVFTLRYARLFYDNRGRGVDFNEDDPPDYRDFAYLALTIGMTFQVSDTDLTSKAIRRTALRHALISWLFGAVIVGLTINILASVLSSGGS